MSRRALEAGWTSDQLKRSLRDEAWRPIRRGAWAEPGTEIDNVLRLRAVQQLRPDLTVSHRTAAALHGIEVPVERTEFTSLTGRRTLMTDIVQHQVPLTEEAVWTRQGLRLTNPARTIADLLREGPRDEALVALDSALTKRRPQGQARRPPLVTLIEVRTEIGSTAKGAKQARTWLAYGDPGAGSPAETLARLRIGDAGLYPESQVRMVTPLTGHVRYPDFYFRQARVIVEIEGYAFHGTRAAHREDAARFNELQLCPEVRMILRYPASVVLHQPAKMIAEIRAAVGSATGRPLLTNPSGA
ncbi:hypothetical protein [Streptomyces sp. NPDC050738]|uniref:hypothetical protein n=1 Tax=Streptomyces sp. NPDC050738 TaxID=3154744 RepID=UPI00341280BC